LGTGFAAGFDLVAGALEAGALEAGALEAGALEAETLAAGLAGFFTAADLLVLAMNARPSGSPDWGGFRRPVRLEEREF
jgi:hypothetical protein